MDVEVLNGTFYVAPDSSEAGRPLDRYKLAMVFRKLKSVLPLIDIGCVTARPGIFESFKVGQAELGHRRSKVHFDHFAVVWSGSCLGWSCNPR